MVDPNDVFFVGPPVPPEFFVERKEINWIEEALNEDKLLLLMVNQEW